MALLGRFFGGAASNAAGIGIGQPAAAVLTPPVQALLNERWNAHQTMPLDPYSLAQGVAEGQIERQWGRDEATLMGINEGRFDRLVQVFDSGPGVGAAFTLWRRDKIGEPGFRRALKREGLEDEWIDALVLTKHVPLTPEQLANAIQQGFVPGAGLLAGDPGGTRGITPPVEQIDLDTLGEAESGGYDRNHMAVLAQLVGLPPGAMELLTMWNRGIITEEAVERGLREGHTKTKWTSAIKQLRHHILSPSQAAGLRLRGWITKGEAEDIGALSGADAETMQRLWQVSGRPATTRQAWIGTARGGTYDGPIAGIPAYFLNAVRQSNIRPEWTNLLWAQRHTYPSAFVIRALASDGTFPPELTETILFESGWKREWAQLAAAKWGATDSGGAAQKWADRARTRLFTAAHQEFLDESITTAKARAILADIGVAKGEQDAVIRLWEAELGITRRELSPADIRKAYKKGAYTQEQAISELIERHMSPDDADTYLQSA